MKEIKTSSGRETIQVAKKFSKALKPGNVLLLKGNLGSGKTTFVKGIVEGLSGAKESEVTSPTFVIMHHYKGKIPVYHFDLYRLETQHELEAIGFDEFINDPAAISCIEWPEKAGAMLPPDALTVNFEFVEGEERMIRLPETGR